MDSPAPSPRSRPRRRLAALRALIAAFQHEGVVYWARVAGFDVTITPLLPREVRALRDETARRLDARSTPPHPGANRHGSPAGGDGNRHRFPLPASLRIRRRRVSRTP